MPAASAIPARPRPGRADLYLEVTKRIIAELEAGSFPWVQPWGTSEVAAPLGMPCNGATGRRYSGVNILLLWMAVRERGYQGQRWLTFRQALLLGGYVRKGEHGATVVFADRFVPGDERERAAQAGEEPRQVPFLKRFTLFNTEQCEGLPADLADADTAVEESLILPRVEALIAASGIAVRIEGETASYHPGLDVVQVPPPQAFFAPIDWHRTALHELTHAVGHPARLGRDQSGAYGSPAYAFEELVALSGQSAPVLY